MNELSEEEYNSMLKQQSHMYDWCLRNIGKYSREEAKAETEEFYTYESPKESSRGLFFHEDAWHCAMLRLQGEQYWLSFSELEKESFEYSNEWERYEQSNT